MSLQTLRQDARRELGNRMDLRGAFGELERLQGRLESGDLTQDEQEREQGELRDTTEDLCELLESEGMFEISEMLAFEMEL